MIESLQFFFFFFHLRYRSIKARQVEPAQVNETRDSCFLLRGLLQHDERGAALALAVLSALANFLATYLAELAWM